MMAELEDGFGSDDDEEIEVEGSSDDDEEASGHDAEEEDENSGNESSEFGDMEDGEDWLGIGEMKKETAGEEASDTENGSDDEVETKGWLWAHLFGPQADRDYCSGATGFAALADLEGEMESDEDGVSAGSDDDTPMDLRQRSKSPEDDPNAAEAKAAKAYFTAHSNAETTSASGSFSTLPGCTLSRQLLLSLGSLNLTKPTPIQRECIPVAMMGKDIVASSATGSGKTVAFWVGVLERLLHRDRRNPTTRVVVMTPTRELAVQVHGVGVALARYTDIQFCLCVGECSCVLQLGPQLIWL